MYYFATRLEAVKANAETDLRVNLMFKGQIFFISILFS